MTPELLPCLSALQPDFSPGPKESSFNFPGAFADRRIFFTVYSCHPVEVWSEVSKQRQHRLTRLRQTTALKRFHALEQFWL